MPAILTIAEAARRIAAKQLSPVELTKTHLDRIRRLDPELNAFLARYGRARAGRCQGRRSAADVGHAARPARRHPDRPQGHLQYRRHPHDGAFEAAGAQRAHARCAHREKVGGRGHRHAGQAGDARVRLRWAVLRSAVAAAHAIPGTGTTSRRLVLGHRGGRGRGSHPGRNRLRHRRIDPWTGGALRHCRDQADLWPVQPGGHSAARLLARSRRPDGLDGGRLRRCCCRAWPVTIPRTRPASTGRSRISRPSSARASKGLRIGVVRHFFEEDHRASDATRAGIDAALDFFRKEGAEVRDITPVAGGGLPRGRLSDHGHRGVHAARRRGCASVSWTTASCSATVSRLPPPSAARTSSRPRAAAACCAGKWRRRWKISTSSSARPSRARRRASTAVHEMGQHGEAVLHHAVQCHGLSGDQHLHRFRRGRAFP